MAEKDIQVCFNPHFDAVSLWLGSFGGADSPCDISRGVFAAKRGVPRLLDFFRRYDITTTWHITGHSIESFPKAAEMIAKDGHEVGVHGYSHENPLAMSPQQERGRSRKEHRALSGVDRQKAKRLRDTVGGIHPHHRGLAAGVRLFARVQHDGGRLFSVLPTDRR